MLRYQDHSLLRLLQTHPLIGGFLGMNGRWDTSKAASPCASAFRPQPPSTAAANGYLSRKLRFAGALVLSVLAHLLVLLLPYACGGGDGGDPGPVGAVNVRILRVPAAAPDGFYLPGEAHESALLQTEPVSEFPGPVSAGQTRESGVGHLPIPGQAFFPPTLLSRKPVLLDNDPLESTPLYVLAPPGKLLLKLWIDDRGRVIEVETESTDLPAEFAVAASEAFSRARFSPGERGGLPVGTVLRIEVNHSDTRRSS